MRSHFQLIGYHLRGLLRFTGRDSRPTFWAWALSVLVAGTGVMSTIAMPVMIGILGLAGERPFSGSIEREAAVFGTVAMPMIIATAVIAAITIPLVAASVARRLHDGGRSGAWGLLPLPFLATGLILYPQIFGAIAPEGGPGDLFFAALANNLIYLATLLYLVRLLTRDSDPGPNRYGPPPG